MQTLFLILSLVTTAYTRGAFHTACSQTVSVSADSMQVVLNRFVYELQTDPDLLFDWAFAGTGTQGDTLYDAMQLQYYESVYDPITRHAQLRLDILTNGKPRFKNIMLETWCRDIGNTLSPSDTLPAHHTRIDIEESSKLTQAAYLEFVVIPEANNTCHVTCNLYLRFGWFFNLFITKRVYKNVIEWRVAQMFDNLCRYTETGVVSP